MQMINILELLEKQPHREYMFRDELVWDAIHNSEEMKGSLSQSIRDIKNNEVYDKLFHEAYSKERDPVSAFNIANAIPSYIRSLITMNNRFDQIYAGRQNKIIGR
jgi:cytochrome c peroxidase